MVDKEKGRGPGKEKEMEGAVIAMLAVAVPIIMLPVAFVGYLTIGGALTAAKEARKQKAAKAKAVAG